MTRPTEWCIRAGRYAARLDAKGETDDRLRSLLRDLHTSAPMSSTSQIEVTASSNDLFVLRSDGRVWDDAVPAPEVPDQVVRMVLRASLDEEDELVHIHAGAVGLDDSTAVLAGWPASGKSTAITHLVGAGFTYVTDERLVVAADGRSVSGFPKPISLVEGSFGAMAHLDPRRTGHGASSATTWQIPASSLGPVAPQAFRRATLLVFIAYRPSAPLKVTTVAPDAAAARLLGDSPDVIARGRDGARAIVRLAASVPSVELEYSDPDALVAAMRDLMARAPDLDRTLLDQPVELDGAAPPAQAPPPGALDTARRYSIVDGTWVWILDDRAVAYVHPAGEVVELDETSAVWLQLLDGHLPLEALIDEVAAATATDSDAVGATAVHVMHSLWTVGVIAPLPGTTSG